MRCCDGVLRIVHGCQRGGMRRTGGGADGANGYERWAATDTLYYYIAYPLFWALYNLHKRPADSELAFWEIHIKESYQVCIAVSDRAERVDSAWNCRVRLASSAVPFAPT